MSPNCRYSPIFKNSIVIHQGQFNETSMTEEKLLREKFGIVELSLIDAHTATLHKILPPKE